MQPINLKIVRIKASWGPLKAWGPLKVWGPQKSIPCPPPLHLSRWACTQLKLPAPGKPTFVLTSQPQVSLVQSGSFCRWGPSLRPQGLPTIGQISSSRPHQMLMIIIWCIHTYHPMADVNGDFPGTSPSSAAINTSPVSLRGRGRHGRGGVSHRPLRGLLSRVSVSLDGRSSAIVGAWGRWPAHKESQTGLNNQR